jgi:cation:H+ antiporter
VLTALVAIAIHLGGRFGSVSLGGVGLGSLVILATYGLMLRMIYYAQRQAVASLPVEEPASGQGMTLRVAVAGFIISAIAILVTAPILARTAGVLAEISGLGNTFVGTTFVAFSTSLPELVATLAAVRMKAFDLALGNIFGSNAFNMILFVPLDLVNGGPVFAAVGQTHVLTALAVIAVTSVAVLGQLYSVERRTPLIEPDAWLMIVAIMTTLMLIYHAR